VVFYFAYGANMSEEKMEERGINFLSAFSGFLCGWKRTFDKPTKSGFAAANIVETGNSYQWGVIYSLCSEEELEKLDKFEGSGYERITIEAWLPFKNEFLDVVVYRAVKTKEGLKPTRSYIFNLIYGAESHGIDSTELRKLKDMP